jgi:hypothetical protein
MVKYVFIFYYDIVVFDIVNIGKLIKTSEQATDRNNWGNKETPSSAREGFALAACLSHS